MRLYVTNLGTWFSNKAEVERALFEDGASGWSSVEVPTDKAGLLEFLNDRRVGRWSALPEPGPAEGATAISRTDQAIAFEDAFEAMPLALKLHFAALAMEEARDLIAGHSILICPENPITVPVEVDHG